LKIVHCSDIHIGTEVPGLVDGFIAAVAEIEPDLVVASGDFTMAGRHREFRGAARLLDRLSAPIIATPGNHDIPVYNLFERFANPFGRFSKYIGSRSQASFASPDAALLSLPSARPWDLSLDWSRGRLSNAQIGEADRFFAEHRSSRFRALVVHHPFFVPEGLPGFRTIGNGDAMLRVLAECRVHAVLSGHLHQQSVTIRHLRLGTESIGISLIQVASATSDRHRDEPNAFGLLEIGDAGITVTDYVAHGGRFVADGSRPIEHRSPQDAEQA
jgi:3',5'-cyclic AMP phosphodiesterase CpdA